MSRTASPAVRAALIDAAAAMLVAREPVSLRSLTARAGTTTMAVYTHFGGMPGLWSAVRQEGFGRLAERLGRVATTDDPVRDLAALGAAYAAHALAHPALYRVMFDAAADLDEPDAATATFVPLVAAVSRAVAAGTPRRRRPLRARHPLLGLGPRRGDAGGVRRPPGRRPRRPLAGARDRAVPRRRRRRRAVRGLGPGRVGLGPLRSRGDGVSSAGSGGAVGVGPSWGGVNPGPAVAHLHGPAAVVDGNVMEAAEQAEIREVGGAPVGPVFEVVGVAAPRSAGAAGERAPAVAVLQRAALRVGDGPGEPPEVEGFGAGPEDDGHDPRVARQPAGGGGADRGVGVEHRVPDLLLQPPVIDGDHQQGAAAAPDRCRRGLVEVVVLGGPRRRDG